MNALKYEPVELSGIQEDEIEVKLNDENNNRASIEICMFEMITAGDSVSLRLFVANDLLIKSILATMVDSYNQNCLLIAVKLNNAELVDYLLDQIKSIDLNHCDNGGWTALRYCDLSESFFLKTLNPKSRVRLRNLSN